MEPFGGLDLRFSKRWKGLRERYFIRRGLNWYGDNTNQRVIELRLNYGTI
jgi:hypothetical protein